MKEPRRYLHKGFTITELAMVVGLLGILTAIVSIGFGSSQQGLAQRQVQTELRSVMTAINNERMMQNQFTVVTVPTTTLPAMYKPGDSVTITYAWVSKKRVCFNGVSKKYASITYYIGTSAQDPVAGSCPAAPADLASDNT